MTQKFYPIDKILCHHQKISLLKNTFEVTLHDLFNIFILFNKVSYIKLNFKLKIDSKMCTFKNLKEIWKIGKKLKKRVVTLLVPPK